MGLLSRVPGVPWPPPPASCPVISPSGPWLLPILLPSSPALQGPSQAAPELGRALRTNPSCPRTFPLLPPSLYSLLQPPHSVPPASLFFPRACRLTLSFPGLCSDVTGQRGFPDHLISNVMPSHTSPFPASFFSLAPLTGPHTPCIVYLSCLGSVALHCSVKHQESRRVNLFFAKYPQHRLPAR